MSEISITTVEEEIEDETFPCVVVNSTRAVEEKLLQVYPSEYGVDLCVGRDTICLTWAEWDTLVAQISARRPDA